MAKLKGHGRIVATFKSEPMQIDQARTEARVLARYAKTLGYEIEIKVEGESDMGKVQVQTLDCSRSSNLKRATWLDGVLTVTFKDKQGRETQTWEYRTVSETTWKEFQAAESFGNFLRKSIMGKHSEWRVS